MQFALVYILEPALFTSDILPSLPFFYQGSKATFFNLTDKTGVAAQHTMQKLHLSCTPYAQDNNETVFHLCITWEDLSTIIMHNLNSETQKHICFDKGYSFEMQALVHKQMNFHTLITQTK